MNASRSKTVVRAILILTAAASIASWTYRFVDEHTRFEEIAFCILVPLVCWILFAGPLLLLGNGRKFLRIAGAVLLVPTTLLWAVSILVGINGLKIH